MIKREGIAGALQRRVDKYVAIQKWLTKVRHTIIQAAEKAADEHRYNTAVFIPLFSIDKMISLDAEVELINSLRRDGFDAAINPQEEMKDHMCIALHWGSSRSF